MNDPRRILLETTFQAWRMLQFSSGGSAGGVFLGNPENNNNNNNESTNTPATTPVVDDTSAADRALDIAILIAAGLAILVGLLAATWLAAKIMDQYCFCRSGVSFDFETDRGMICRKAGLLGLFRTERIMILKHLFEPVEWQGQPREDDGEEDSPSEQDTPKEDITLGERNENAMLEGNTEQKASADDDDDDDDDENNNDNEEPLDDAEHERVCCICLTAYAPKCQVITGKTCSHMFHYDCCLEWMSRHDDCPYCRQELMTSEQFGEAALEVLGAARVEDMREARRHMDAMVANNSLALTRLDEDGVSETRRSNALQVGDIELGAISTASDDDVSRTGRRESQHSSSSVSA